MIRKRLLTTLILLSFSLAAVCQPADNADEERVLALYEKQLSDGLLSRGMSVSEIEKYMARGKNGINSINDFSQELLSLYAPAAAKKMAVLFYFFSNDTLHRYFITPGHIKEKAQIAITKNQLEQLNTDVLNALKVYDLSQNRSPKNRGTIPLAAPKKSGVNFNDAIKNAGKILLPKSFDEQYEQLVVIPAFSIGAFPFQLLRPYKDNSFLAERCSFTVAPGLLDFMAIRKKILKDVFFVAKNEVDRIPDSINFTFDNPLFVCNPAYPTTSPFIFPDLPGAKKEIKASIAYAKNYILLEGREATKANVLKHLRNADVAYFATHAMSSEVNPKDNNFLVLSGEEDPFFTTRNIMALRDTNVQGDYKFPSLVILSACQTGLGKSMEAGITSGVARSFLIAGASQVVMSLWSVDDEATAYLMSRFAYHLRNKNPHTPSEPLRLAQADTRKRYPNPAHWASFAVYGVNY